MTIEDLKKDICAFSSWIYWKVLKLEPDEVECNNRANKVAASMKTTAISRYNASNRLAWQSKIAFLTTTVLSLGLIFIPLMQLAKVKLQFNDSVLGAVQIFMAVAVLVYSVIIGTAKYETRCENLNDCGDKIKDLIRELRREVKQGVEVDTEVLGDIQRRYADIVADVENHERCDYTLTILRCPDLYRISVICWLKYWISYLLRIFLNYIPTILLLLAEILIITDMFAITTYFEFLKKT